MQTAAHNRRTATQAKALTKNDLLLATDLSRFFDDPLGFVLYVFPWGKPGTRLALSLIHI